MATAENLKYTKEFAPQITSYDPEKHTMVFWITSSTLDYHGERINPDGVKFVPRPKLLKNHDWSGDPLGGIIWVGRQGDKWKAMVEFDQDDPEAVMQEKKYAKGYKTDCSIGFLTNTKAISRDEDNNIVHNDILVKELSLVTFGANPDAVAKSEFTNEELSEMANEAVNVKVKSFFENVIKEKTLENENKNLKSLEDKIEDLDLSFEEIKGDLVKLEEGHILVEKAIENDEARKSEIATLKEEVANLTKIINGKIKANEKAIMKNAIKDLVSLEMKKIAKRIK